MYRIFLCLLLTVAPLNAQDDFGTDPDEWIVKSYPFRFPGFYDSIEEERIVGLPSEGADEETIRAFMKKSHKAIAGLPSITELNFPKGALFLYDPQSSNLTARLPRAEHFRLKDLSTEYERTFESQVEADIFIFEASPEMARSIMEKASIAADQTNSLQLLQSAAELEKAKLIFHERVVTSSGHEVEVSDGEEVVWFDPVSIGPDKRKKNVQHRELFGTYFEMEPVIGSDEQVIDIQFNLSHHQHPPVERELPRTESRILDLPSPLRDLFKTEIKSNVTVSNGDTHLLAVWKPKIPTSHSERETPHRLALLRGRVVPLLPKPDERLVEYIDRYGDSVIPIPKNAAEKRDPENGMVLKRYFIPLTILGPPRKTRAGSGPQVETDLARPSAQSILENAGINFPPESFARFDPESCILTVQNTPKQIELVELYLEPMQPGVEKYFCVTYHVIEAPAEVLEQVMKNTEGKSDHTAEWKQLQNREDVQFVGSYQLSGRSGMRAKLLTYTPFIYPSVGRAESDESSDATEEAQGHQWDFETEPVGTHIEFDPVLGGDELTLDFNFLFQQDFAPPWMESLSGQYQTTFFREKVTAPLTMHKGSTRLLRIWFANDGEKQEEPPTRHALFLTVDVLEHSTE